MSGLILPSYRKHWRTNWDALLMSLRLTSGHLTYTPSGYLALCSAPSGPCCDQGLPVSVTLSGATGCLSPGNGTFVTSSIGSCQKEYVDLPSQTDPCGASCYTSVILGTTYYWKLGQLRITTSADPSTQYAYVSVEYTLFLYYLDFGVCKRRPGVNEFAFMYYETNDCTTSFTEDASQRIDSPSGTLPTTLTVNY